ncbi:hypothetical protein QM012_008326 [Aureobasidium pullulans]|uniref:Uncharacterized protein n=1 Tax=Aureobasidium pullulans TaxID=5580 RepID=A0ABR0TJP6_AURPU
MPTGRRRNVQREQIAAAEFGAQAAKEALAREKEMTKALQSEKAELVRELYQKTVELGVKTALLEGST